MCKGVCKWHHKCFGVISVINRELSRSFFDWCWDLWVMLPLIFKDLWLAWLLRTGKEVISARSGYTCDLVQHFECFRNTEFIEFTEEDAALRAASQELSISLLWSLLKCPFIAMRLMSVLWDDRVELQGLINMHLSNKKASSRNINISNQGLPPVLQNHFHMWGGGLPWNIHSKTKRQCSQMAFWCES